MGFILSILYLTLAHVGVGTVFGQLAQLRVELILAALVALVSLFAIARSFVLKTPQSAALIGLTIAVFFSVLVGVHWATGAVRAVLEFVPNIYAFFLVCLHCNTLTRLRVVVLMLLLTCGYVITCGSIELSQRNQASGSLQASTLSGTSSQDSDDAHLTPESSYLFAMKNKSGEWFYRLRGQGFFHDPNDFAQLAVCVIPLMFVFWRSGKSARNFALVLLPISALLYGIYLTHSRGAIVALAIVLVVAARRRLGIFPSLVLGGLVMIAASALGASGGRDISVEAGSDRTALWGGGLGVLKSHPLFGVGLGQLPEYLEGQTAHDSIIVCASELGLLGLFFWSLYLIATMRDVLSVTSASSMPDAPSPEPEVLQPQWMMERNRPIDPVEVKKWGRLILLSLTGFLAAGMFLSRAFAMPLFLLGGMGAVIFEMARVRGWVAPRVAPLRLARHAAALGFVAVLGMYIILRITNLMH